MKNILWLAASAAMLMPSLAAAAELEPPPEPDVIATSTVVALASLFVVGLLFLVGLIRSQLFICRPNELLIISGKKHRLANGESANFTVILAGMHLRIPFLQKVDRMDLRVIPIELNVTKVLSNGGIPLDIHAIANVKISSDERFVYNAVERFLGLPREAIWQTAKQTLEGSLRDVISQLTPEQVNQDRIEFANQLVQVTSQVFSKMGLQIDTLKIQRVEDEANYLVNLGRGQIANAIRDAENAENQANQEVAQEEAGARQQAEVAAKDAEIGIAQKRNQLRQLVGKLEGEAQAVEREAKAAVEQARALAEQELQELRREVEQRRLNVEVVLPAEAQREAALLLAEGEAAPRREQGAAAAEAMRMLAEALATAGPQAREMFVLSQLDTLVAQVAEKAAGLSVREIQIIDNGDGRSLPSVAASYPMIVTEVLRTLKDLTGVDIPAILNPDAANAGGRS
jgi:flotillin